MPAFYAFGYTRAMRRTLLLVAFSVAATLGLIAQNGLTPEWINSDAARALTDLPTSAWLRDGSLVVLDPSRPERERGFERIVPGMGARTQLFDMRKAISSLQETGAAAGRTTLEWPTALDESGARLVYALDRDLYCVDIASSRATRLTHDDAEERNVSVSPDGSRVAFVRGRNLFTLELATGRETALTNDGSETRLNGTLSWVYWEEVFGRRDLAYWWSPDGRQIAYLQTDESPVSVSHFVAFEPATPRVIRQRYPKAGGANPMVRVGIVPVSGGATRWVRIEDAPFEYVLRVGWLPDASRVSVQTLTRDQRTLALYFADASTGAARRVLTETDSAWVNVSDDLRFLASGREFLWSSERTGFRHLYRYSADGTLLNAVTSGEWALASADQTVFWVTRAIAAVDESSGWVYIGSRKDAPVERQLWRVRLDGTGLSRVSTEPGAHNVSFSPDARFYVDGWSNLRRPPSLSLHRADGSGVATLTPDRTDAIARFGVRYPELTTIPAPDGFPFPAQILRPDTMPPSGRVPVVIHVYGGPSAPTVIDQWWDQIFYAQLLNRAGFAIVQVDNRSATGISKRLENTIVSRSGSVETTDLRDAVRWLKRQPWVDPDRVGVYGWSGGGTMTLNLMTRTEEFKAGIAGAPVTDWRYYDSKWAEMLMGRPDDNPEGYRDFNLVDRAAQLHGRLMLVYGTYDDNVHPQNEQAFADALIRAGILFDTMIYPMRKHSFADDPAKTHLLKTMLEFWKRNL
jgi:dipeptidyl-peptidase 4